MELERAIRDRRSIRRFTTSPVPDETIRELLEVARWAPSWANTQCWRVHVVQGDALARIAGELEARAASQVERRFDLPPPKPDWPPPLGRRIEELIAARRGVEAGSEAARGLFFGAPCVLFLTIDERLQPVYAAFDVGLMVQSVCLAAHARGLGTCIMARAVAHPDVLRAELPEARGRRFVVGVALGVPDLQAPINGFPRGRASLDELVSWGR